MDGPLHTKFHLDLSFNFGEILIDTMQYSRERTAYFEEKGEFIMKMISIICNIYNRVIEAWIMGNEKPWMFNLGL